MSGFTDDNDTEETKWYLVTPSYKKSVYEEITCTKMYGDTRVSLKITKIWRYGEFNVELTDVEAKEIVKLNEVNLNNYFTEVVCTDNLYDYDVEVNNIYEYDEELQKQINRDVFEDVDNECPYDEAELVDEHDWEVDDTTYSIVGGVDLDREENCDDESEGENEDESETQDKNEEQQKIMNCDLCCKDKKCDEYYVFKRGRKQELYSCLTCWKINKTRLCNESWTYERQKFPGEAFYSLDDVKSENKNEDKSHNEGETIVSLNTVGGKIVGGSFDPPKEDKEKEEEISYNVYQCSHCGFTTTDTDPDCSKCKKTYCMYAKTMTTCKNEESDEETCEESDEESSEEDIDDEEFKCEKCDTVQGINNCELCDAENVCEECNGCGGDYGPNEIWVCNNCLPTCNGCGKKLFTAWDECCGKGRSDLTQDKDDEEDKETAIMNGGPGYWDKSDY